MKVPNQISPKVFQACFETAHNTMKKKSGALDSEKEMKEEQLKNIFRKLS